MVKVIVLGGCGAVGRVVVKTLSQQVSFDSVIIGDINEAKANEIISQTGSKKISFVKFDASNAESVKEAIKSCDMVVNCVGPFYKTVKTILSAVIESKINYVDVCDDVDVTMDILNMDMDAKNAGITALIGMGNSPGVTNLLAKFAADSLLDETDSIDIFHAHGGEPFEGEGVIGHRFHCMSIDIPMFLDGELRYVKYFEPDGIALRQLFNFPIVGNNIELYPYPHPEQITLPKYIKLKRVTNKGTVLPKEYYNLTRDLCYLGLADKNPINIKGQSVAPYDFATAYLIAQREKILKETNFGQQRGCCSVVAKGKKDGKNQEYRFHLASKTQALGEGTGIPAAIGAILMHQGKVNIKGVFPPEGCVNPQDFISLVQKVMNLDKKEKSNGSFSGVILESIDENDKVTTMNI